MVTRMTGLSGLDTETLVQQMMLKSQTKYNNLYKKKTEAEWKKTLYGEIHSQLNELNKKLFDYSLSSKTMTKSTSISNDAVATVSAGSNAANASHTLKVTQLATGASAASSGTITPAALNVYSLKLVNNTEPLAEQLDLNLGTGETASFTINGTTTITIDENTTIDDLVGQINSSGAGVKAFYNSSVNQFYLRADGSNPDNIKVEAITGDAKSEELIDALRLTQPGVNKDTLSTQFGIAPNTDLTFEINGKTVNINSSDSISTLVSRINSSGAGVTASYDVNMDKFFISTTSTGEAAKIGFTASGAAAVEFLDKLQLKDGSNQSIVANGPALKGKNAEFEIDGIALSQSSNDFNISGINYSLKSTNDSPVLVTVKTDNKAILDNVKSLVETYNNLLSTIYSKTSEKYYRDFGPLTDEQKKEMKDKEIELWEEKAKSGILRNDSTLKGLASKMRTAMYSVSNSVNGNYNSLYKLGISTTDYSDQGKLTIDEDKFLKALEDDPEAAYKLFAAEDGFINTLRKDIQSAMKDLETKSGAGLLVDTSSSLYKQINRWGKEMDSLSARMIEEENRYYKQFSALETALNKMNSQSNYLTSMLGQ